MRDHLPVSVRARAATGHRYVPEIAELLDINANGHRRGLAPAGPGTGGSELPSDGRGVTEHDARLLSNHLYAGSPHPSSRAPSAGPEYANQQDLMLVGGRASVASVASFASAGAAASGRHSASSIGRHLQATVFDAEARPAVNTALVNLQDERGNTPVAWAVRGGKAEVVELLIHHHASCSLPNNEGVLPLHTACLQGGDPHVVQTLLPATLSVNAQDHTGNTALMCAAKADSPEIISVLLINGADAALKNVHGMTALMEATTAANLKALRRLLKVRDIQPCAQDRTGRTALHWACALGVLEPARLLLAKDLQSIFVESANGDTACHACVSGGNAAIMHDLLQRLS